MPNYALFFKDDDIKENNPPPLFPPIPIVDMVDTASKTFCTCVREARKSTLVTLGNCCNKLRSKAGTSGVLKAAM